MRIRILKNRDFTPPEERRVTLAFRAGTEDTVKRAWGEQLVADGDAEEIDAPARADEPGSSAPVKRPLTPAQIKALDGDRDGNAGGSMPKAKA